MLFNLSDKHIFLIRCRPPNLPPPELRTSGHFYSSGSVINTILSQVVQLPVIPASPAMDQNNQGPPSPFHCSLLAPTAITTKINEETLTYLNQGKGKHLGFCKILISFQIFFYIHVCLFLNFKVLCFVADRRSCVFIFISCLLYTCKHSHIFMTLFFVLTFVRWLFY